MRWRNALVATLALIAAVSCDQQPLEPHQEVVATAPEFAVSTGHAQTKIAICHRTRGTHDFILISVSQTAVDAHMAHGDGQVGGPVPGQAGMNFNDACKPVPSRRVITVTGTWNGTSYLFSGLFTVAYAGPVDAIATVNGFAGPMRLALLGYKSGQASSCSTAWLPTPLPPGPTMSPPTVTAHWDEVPPGTYCLNVVTASAVPPWPSPYSWTATITYP